MLLYFSCMLYLFDVVYEGGDAANLKAEFFQRLQPFAKL